MRNAQTPQGMKKARLNFDDFDVLPLHVKQYIWNAPTSLQWVGKFDATPERFRALCADYEQKVAKNTARIYGPSHPQAWGRELRASDLSDSDFL